MSRWADADLNQIHNHGHPCTFAQAPTSGDCEGILAWHIRKGNYGNVRLDG